MDLGFVGFSLLKSEISGRRRFLQLLVLVRSFLVDLVAKASAHVDGISCIKVLCYVYDGHNFFKLAGYNLVLGFQRD